ncbi:MAG: NTP transferase domain-containing protein [Acidobacteriia bacterium]|nr:NTP transferase domain-containing protein [Terriglobia bacterium]
MRKAVILAAGRGTRMQDAAGDLPKAMIPLAGKPMLEHILDRLRQAGFTDVALVVGYRAGAIEFHFASYPLALTFIIQTQLNGTAPALLLARGFVGNDPFLLTFGDTLTTVDDYRRMWSRLTADPDAAAVAVVKHVEDPWQGAAVYEQDGVLTGIIEKPAPGTSTTHWNSAGSYVFRPEVFPQLERVPLSPRGEYEVTSAVSQMIEAGNRLLLYPLQDGWRDVGRPSDIDAAEALLSEQRER